MIVVMVKKSAASLEARALAYTLYGSFQKKQFPSAFPYWHYTHIIQEELDALVLKNEQEQGTTVL